PSLAELASRVNALLFASTPSNKYATAFLLAYDPADGNCVYVNGGHNDGIVLRADGSVELLTTTGMPVGLFPRAAFEEGRVTLGPGDSVTLYSDGVSEAENSTEDQFGMDRMTDVLRAEQSEPTSRMVEAMFQAIDGFAGTAPQHDDITLMILKRQGK